jgi:tRNA pseudouridine synthase 10
MSGQASAGTYIKEFVHGDFGRTQPNLGSLLDCNAQILQLDVMDVHLDFL